MGDALAPRDDEGRGKLRKAAGRCKRPVIRRCPNGETLPDEVGKPARGETRGTETSKYPEEEKTTVIPQVVASESGEAQTRGHAPWGCRACTIDGNASGTCLESAAIAGDSPVHAKLHTWRVP